MVFACSSFACVLSYIYDKKKLIVRCIQYAGIYGKSLKLLKKVYLAKGVCSTWYTEVMGSVRMRLRSRSSCSSSSPSLAVLKSALFKSLRTLIFKNVQTTTDRVELRLLQLQSVTKRFTTVLKINVYTYLCKKWHQLDHMKHFIASGFSKGNRVLSLVIARSGFGFIQNASL